MGILTSIEIELELDWLEMRLDWLRLDAKLALEESNLIVILCLSLD